MVEPREQVTTVEEVGVNRLSQLLKSLREAPITSYAAKLRRTVIMAALVLSFLPASAQRTFADETQSSDPTADEVTDKPKDDAHPVALESSTETTNPIPIQPVAEEAGWVKKSERLRNGSDLVSEGILAGQTFGFRGVRPWTVIPEGQSARIEYDLNISKINPEAKNSQGDPIQMIGGSFFGNGREPGPELRRGIIVAGDNSTGGIGWFLQDAMGDGAGSLGIGKFATTPGSRAQVVVELEANLKDGRVGIPALGQEQLSVSFTLRKPLTDGNPQRGLAQAAFSRDNTRTELDRVAVYTR